MKKNYYFFATALPPIRLGEPVDISVYDFKYFAQINLLKADFEKIQTLLFVFDIDNIRALWRGEDLSSISCIAPDFLDEALASGLMLPDYVLSYLDHYTDKEDRLRYFSKLYHDYYAEESKRATGFLKEYLELERSMRLTFSALRAKDLDLDIVEELQFEDPDDPLVASILSQKSAASFDPPDEMKPIKAIYEEHKKDSYALYQAIMEWRYERVEKMVGIDQFSIDRILCYLIQLVSCIKWLELDEKKGLDMFDAIVRKAI